MFGLLEAFRECEDTTKINTTTTTTNDSILPINGIFPRDWPDQPAAAAAIAKPLSYGTVVVVFDIAKSISTVPKSRACFLTHSGGRQNTSINYVRTLYVAR